MVGGPEDAGLRHPTVFSYGLVPRRPSGGGEVCRSAVVCSDAEKKQSECAHYDTQTEQSTLKYYGSQGMRLCRCQPCNQAP